MSTADEEVKIIRKTDVDAALLLAALSSVNKSTRYRVFYKGMGVMVQRSRSRSADLQILSLRGHRRPWHALHGIDYFASSQ